MLHSMRRLYIPILILFWIACSPQSLGAEEKITEELKRGIDEIVRILKDPSFRTQDNAQKRETLIMNLADKHFDWEEMSRRSLARFWEKRNEIEKKEFVSLFRQLLGITYLGKIERYFDDEKVVFEEERVKNQYALIKSKVLSPEKNSEISVNYRLHKIGNNWFVYDVAVEGVSLVNNYRSQFSDIILHSSYEELVKKVREKVKANQEIRRKS